MCSKPRCSSQRPTVPPPRPRRMLPTFRWPPPAARPRATFRHGSDRLMIFRRIVQTAFKKAEDQAYGQAGHRDHDGRRGEFPRRIEHRETEERRTGRHRRIQANQSGGAARQACSGCERGSHDCPGPLSCPEPIWRCRWLYPVQPFQASNVSSLCWRPTPLTDAPTASVPRGLAGFNTDWRVTR